MVVSSREAEQPTQAHQVYSAGDAQFVALSAGNFAMWPSANQCPSALFPRGLTRDPGSTLLGSHFQFF
jgi:hypothetical protein